MESWGVCLTWLDCKAIKSSLQRFIVYQMMVLTSDFVTNMLW